MAPHFLCKKRGFGCMRFCISACLWEYSVKGFEVDAGLALHRRVVHYNAIQAMLFVCKVAA